MYNFLKTAKNIDPCTAYTFFNKLFPNANISNHWGTLTMPSFIVFNELYKLSKIRFNNKNGHIGSDETAASLLDWQKQTIAFTNIRKDRYPDSFEAIRMLANKKTYARPITHTVMSKLGKSYPNLAEYIDPAFLDIIYTENDTVYLVEDIDKNPCENQSQTYMTIKYLLVIYRLMNKNSELLEKICKIFAENKEELEKLSYIPQHIKICDFIADLIKDNPEYNYDVTDDLKDLFKIDYAEEITKIQNTINTLRANIKDYNEDIQNALNEIDRLNIQATGYRYNSADELPETAKEVIRALTTYKNISKVRVADKTLYFSIQSSLTPNNLEDLPRFIDATSILVKDDEKRLAYAWLKNKEVNIPVYAEIFLQPKGNRYGVPYYSSSNYSEINALGIPHPHLMGYNCYGNYTRVLNNCMLEKDYFGVIEQLIEVISNVNVYDSPVMNLLFKSIHALTISYHTLKIIEYKGNIISYDEWRELTKDETV